VSGKSVHSALSHMGENAIEKSYEVVAALLKLKQKIIQRKSQLDAEPGVGLTKMESRLNINVIHGGIKVNIVPDECIISVDRRLIPEENVKDAKEELMSALAMIKGAQWEINKFLSMPTVPPLDDPIVDQLTQLTKAAGGHGLKFGEMGSGDLGYISALEWKAKHFGSGVIRPDCNIHGKDEFVYIKDIQSLGWVISRFIT
ncbi:MAG: peptidase dimerization domain-containing protein, partial [Chloroflexi bacterium]|nr:peptidase dimerization domain-containing protein [Chloroflexota bacterium]